MKTDYDDKEIEYADCAFTFSDKTLASIANGVLAAAIISVVILLMVASW
jgi:hypothetical protein